MKTRIDTFDTMRANMLRNIVITPYVFFLTFSLNGCGNSVNKANFMDDIENYQISDSGYMIGDLIYSEDFSKGLKNWKLEGKVTANIDEGRLLFESMDPKADNPKGNIWWKVDIKSPFFLSFDYKSLSEKGLSMLFWNATELDGSDVFIRERTGLYEEYINEMHTYHVSFHRFGSGKSNIRKAPGFHLVSSVLDPILPNDTLWHRLVIISMGKRQRIFVDEQLIHDFIDESKPCLNDKSWQHPLPCESTGDVPKHGAIGIRHTQKQKALYDNFKVYRLSWR